MSEITHQKAQALLQAAADGSLGPDEKSALDTHLAGCEKCSAYARELADLEVNLRRVVHAYWNDQQPNLNLNAIINPPTTKLVWNNLLNHTHAMGKVTIMVTLLLGYFLIANLFGFQLSISNNETPTIAPTPNESLLFFTSSPTPSAQLTLAGLTPRNCEAVTYVVQANDTLESIAVGHGTTKEAILEYNNLTSSTVFTGMELIIPSCKSTPSHTATTTITPLNGTIFPVQPE
jgi:hypothetical protein